VCHSCRLGGGGNLSTRADSKGTEAMWDFNRRDGVTFFLGCAIGMVVSITFMSLLMAC